MDSTFSTLSFKVPIFKVPDLRPQIKLFSRCRPSRFPDLHFFLLLTGSLQCNHSCEERDGGVRFLALLLLGWTNQSQVKSYISIHPIPFSNGRNLSNLIEQIESHRDSGSNQLWNSANGFNNIWQAKLCFFQFPSTFRLISASAGDGTSMQNYHIEGEVRLK